MVINSLDELDLNKIPEHVGIILDGNGRWAKKRFMPRVAGHREGMKRVVDIVEASSNLGIKYLSLYAFSTENWKRPSEEVSALMNLLIVYVDAQLKRLSDNNVIVKTIGDISKLPDKSRQAIEKACETTKDNTGMVLNLGLNYGSRSEIIRAVEKIVNSSYDVYKLTEENFKEFLDTKTQPDLDLLIRPGGEKRLSNFMLYQVAYAELYFCDTLWPDFKEEELKNVRAGRANPSLLDNISVEYYGTMTPINQVATINVAEARLLTIQPWDNSVLGEIEKAILKSNLGITPSNDGKIIRLPFPALTEERRKDLVKLVKEYGENAKVAVRNQRRDAMDKVKKMEKKSEISEDELRTAEDDIQKTTDKFVEEIDEISKTKEAELMEI